MEVNFDRLLLFSLHTLQQVVNHSTFNRADFLSVSVADDCLNYNIPIHIDQ